MELPIDIRPLGDGGGILSAFKSFWNQVSSWDFTIFKYFLFGIVVLFFIYIAFLFITGKIRSNNSMFGLDYGVKFVVGNFGAGKTKNLFQYGFIRKQQNPDGILIANIPYNFVDIPFDSKKDFLCLFKDLVQYIRDTNNVEFLKQQKEFPPILLLVDEAHEYLFNRDFKNMSDDVRLLLTQCRKRSIEINLVSQKVPQVDVFLRRLTGIFHQYDTFLNPKRGFRREYIKECINIDSNDINNENDYQILEDCILLPDKVSLWFNKDLKDYYAQKYLTYYVVGGTDVYCDDNDRALLDKGELVYSHNYRWFKGLLDDKLNNLNTPLPPKKSKFALIRDGLFKSDSVNQELIQKQDELIKKLISLVSDDDLQNLGISLDDLKKDKINNDSENINK